MITKCYYCKVVGMIMLKPFRATHNPVDTGGTVVKYMSVKNVVCPICGSILKIDIENKQRQWRESYGG